MTGNQGIEVRTHRSRRAHGGTELRIVQINGAEGDRTLNLHIANAALSQLSYRPNQSDLLKVPFETAERKV